MTNPDLIPMSGGCWRVENGALVPDVAELPPATPPPAETHDAPENAA